MNNTDKEQAINTEKADRKASKAEKTDRKAINTVKTNSTLKIAGIIIAVLLIATLGTSMISLVNSKSTSQIVNKLYDGLKDVYHLDEQETETKEDDVMIGSAYEIKSTKQISDAYKTGNASGLSDRDKETLDMASAVLNEVITDGMTDFEKEKAIYEWMCLEMAGKNSPLTVIPSNGGEDDNPYGVLKYRQAVCVGYATTFRLFMEMMGIPCKVCHNSECYHSWNMVNLDGEWYHTDIYSDMDRADYSHFNCNDQIFKSAQKWDENYFPKANAVKYNMNYINRIPLDSVYDLPSVLRSSLDKQDKGLSVEFTKGIDDNQAKLVEEMINNINCTIPMSETKGYPDAIYISNWTKLPESGNFMLTIAYQHYGSIGEDGAVPDEKLDEAYEDAFGDIVNVNLTDTLVNNWQV